MVRAGDRGAPPSSARPRRAVAVLACMDARLQLEGSLGLEIGDAHVIRNAGGIASEDAIRSLVISQRLLGTTSIIVVHHTDCGMETFTDDALADAVEADVGERPPFAFGAFDDVERDLATTVDALRRNPFLVHRDAISGVVYDVATGAVREVVPTR